MLLKMSLKPCVLSQFVGAHDQDFYGGSKVKEFEKMCCDYFNVDHAITVNSWTSGLIAAVGALDIEPGDEIIVPTWTTCNFHDCTFIGMLFLYLLILKKRHLILIQNLFSKTYQVEQKQLCQLIYLVIQPTDISELRKIANEYGLKIISDSTSTRFI